MKFFGPAFRRAGVRIAALPVIAFTLPGAVGAGDLQVTVTDLRNHDGKLFACLAPVAEAFPDCAHDGRKQVIGAAGQPRLVFEDVPPGQYAIAVFHDENGNGRVDKTLMMPREGFGFSRDAKVRMGPPRFRDASFRIGADGGRQSIRMRYML
ncbi:DUF2141 domain-containing protein [uncultured Croceicoccus sp.]|uniref:DUF2141 domain-containing protein n=1 Tax=uncultured Croceicoccus sp. TaxID=1295329 RepID=UPI0026239F2C|nr:DUF2141 domain-containing protein [uncultured Croceicoccus sp.]